MNNDIVTTKTGYKSLLFDFNYTKFIAAKFISRFGDSIDVIAYGWLVFQLTGSVTLLATLYAVNGIPSFIFNLISGTIVGYFPPKKIVYICDFGRGTSVLLTGILGILGLLRPWHLFLFTLINSTFEAFRSPCEPTLIKKLVPPENYSYAVSFDSTGTIIMELVGYSVAGILISLITASGVIIIDAITFFICGLLILLLKIESESVSKCKLSVQNCIQDFKSGFKYVLGDKFIFSICIFAGFFNFFLVPFNSMKPAYASMILKQGPEVISVMSVSFLLAMAIGSIIIPFFRNKLSNRIMFLTAGFNISISYLAFSQLGKIDNVIFMYIALVAVSVFMGISVPFLTVPIRVSLMAKVSEEYLTRSISLVNALALSSAPLGGALVGILCTFLNLEIVYLIFSVFLLILFLIQIFNKSLKNM